jgi:hypothetical protein
MKRLILLLFLSIMLIIGGCMKESNTGANLGIYESEYKDSRPLSLLKIDIPKKEIGKYDLFELSIFLQGSYLNPFDPQEIDVEGIFVDQKGNQYKIPGFFYQEYKRELKTDHEELIPVGDPYFKIRFSPLAVGSYTFYVRVKDRTGKEVSSDKYTIYVKDSEKPGYIRVSEKDWRYFKFDNGRQFLPISANICWAGAKGTYDYDEWLPKYAENGGNYFRVWLGPSWATFALERKSVKEYDLKNAWKLDYVLNLAEKLNMYIMFCFDSYNELRYQREGAYPYWEYTPHNEKNGGPLKEPRDFWTNSEMLKYYKNKLRYIVARYGYSTNVFAWEFWNEVDIISPTAFVIGEVKKWHEDMAKYLNSIDPWKHLITTSFAYSPGKPEIDSISELNFVQTHIYQSNRYIDALLSLIAYKEKYKKPHLVGEFGLDAGGNDPWIDPYGYAIHNAIWTTVLSGASGTAMSWWWDNHIHPNNLYFHYRALVDFVKDINFLDGKFERLTNYKLNVNNREIKVIGLQGKKYILLWLYDMKEAYQYKKGIPNMESSKFLGSIELLLKPPIKVIYYDTYRGEKIRELNLSENIIPIIDFERDLAIKIELLGEGE